MIFGLRIHSNRRLVPTAPYTKEPILEVTIRKSIEEYFPHAFLLFLQKAIANQELTLVYTHLVVGVVLTKWLDVVRLVNDMSPKTVYLAKSQQRQARIAPCFTICSRARGRHNPNVSLTTFGRGRLSLKRT